MKQVLITGKDSYIGTSLANWLAGEPGKYKVDTVDMRDQSWKDKAFSAYDSVFHVAGIAHVSADPKLKDLYYQVNRDLAVAAAEKAKVEGVRQFIFMSSIIVYGDSSSKRVIDRNTIPTPGNFYGDSKLQAEEAIKRLAGDDFKIVILRPPMIYGKGSKGNYPKLAKLAKKLPFFPDIDNARSMLHIDNLCEFIKLMIDEDESGLFFPQNKEYVNTSEMVRLIAESHGRSIKLTKVFNRPLGLLGSKLGLVNKAFGNLVYEQSISEYKLDYRIRDLRQSIEVTEQATWPLKKNKKTHILVIAQYFYPEQFRINDICTEWVKRGYTVTVITGIPNYPQGKYYDGYGLFKKRQERYNDINIIRIPLIPRGNSALMLVLNYISFVVSGYFWAKFTKIKPDYVFIFEVSPMTQALPGVWHAKRRKIPCYLYVTDLWPDNVESASGITNKHLLNAIGVMVDYIYKRCDRIFTSSEMFITAIHDRGVDQGKLEFWPQYAESYYSPTNKVTANVTEIPQDGIFNILFAGNIGAAQGLDVLVEAARILKGENTKARFNIVGDGRYKETLKGQVALNKVEDFFNFIDKQPADRIPQFMAVSDATLISLSKSKSFSMTLPGKTQSCLACGVPVLVSADGEIQDVINRSGAGICSGAGDAVGLAKNIQVLISYPKQKRMEMSNNAANYCQLNFDKETLLTKMDKWFQR